MITRWQAVEASSSLEAQAEVFLAFMPFVNNHTKTKNIDSKISTRKKE